MNFKKYVLIYEVKPNAVEILAVMHSSRNPKKFDDLAG